MIQALSRESVPGLEFKLGEPVNCDDVHKDIVGQSCFCVVLEGGMWGLRDSVDVNRSGFSCSLYRCKITA